MKVFGIKKIKWKSIYRKCNVKKEDNKTRKIKIIRKFHEEDELIQTKSVMIEQSNKWLTNNCTSNILINIDIFRTINNNIWDNNKDNREQVCILVVLTGHMVSEEIILNNYVVHIEVITIHVWKYLI